MSSGVSRGVQRTRKHIFSGNKVDSYVMFLSDPGTKHKVSKETQKLYTLNSISISARLFIQVTEFNILLAQLADAPLLSTPP